MKYFVVRVVNKDCVPALYARIARVPIFNLVPFLIRERGIGHFLSMVPPCSQQKAFLVAAGYRFGTGDLDVVSYFIEKDFLPDCKNIIVESCFPWSLYKRNVSISAFLIPGKMSQEMEKFQASEIWNRNLGLNLA